MQVAQRVIDLSGPISPGVWSYNVLPQIQPKLPLVEVEEVASAARDGWEAHRLVLSTCGGCTYIETSAHMVPGRPRAADVDVAAFLRPAAVVLLPRKAPRSLITAADLAVAAPEIHPGDALLTSCGWGERWDQPGYVEECPTWSADAMEWALERRIGLLATDLPDLEAPSEACRVLRPLFEHDVLLLAPIVNLESARRPRGQIIALPLPVLGVCATPTLAVFVEED